MQEKRKTDEYIFCSVQFGEDSKSYYYLADDATFAIGDFVIVPVGDDGHSAIVEVVNIEYFQEDNVPFPLDEIKRITRKCADGDFGTSIEANIQRDEDIETNKMKQNNEDQSENEGFMTLDEEILLCDEQTTRVRVIIWAELSEGCLKISGQDLGEAVMEFFGDSDYEYFYNFDQENTERLFKLINPEGQRLSDVLIQRFGGMDGCRIMREFCDANSITYSFFSC
ncbi:MAG: hypothetical protein RBS51_07620 [Anaerovoracaceae bacterium]|jgi:hypothetical protein|nr:hypothetical protein [Anaerovoracaceae bacterium]